MKISAVSQSLVSARPVSARFGLLAQGVGATEFQKLSDFKGNDDTMAWARELEAMRKQPGEMSFSRVAGLYATEANRQLPKNVLPAKVGEELLAAMLDRDTVRLMVAGPQHQQAFQTRAVGHVHALAQSPYLFSPTSPVAASLLRLKQQLLIAGTPPTASPPST